MTILSVNTFSGLRPRVNARLLPESAATTSLNAKLQTGTLAPYRDVSQVATLSKPGVIKSLYKFGEENTTEDNYWFHWTQEVSVVKGPLSDDPYERTYYTGDGLPKVTTNAIALTGGTNYPMNSYTLGIPFPLNSANLAVVGVAPEGESTPETRVYTYTYVSELGEEGSSADPSVLIDVLPGQSVQLSNMSTAPLGSYNITAKRIYRSVLGTAGTAFLFVAEIPVATVVYTDAIDAANLGEPLATQTWVPPPTDMFGLTLMANGILVGFSGKDICFSEPFVPHAYPIEYRLQTDYPIVGGAAFGNSLFVGTTGIPYILTGVDPANMNMVKGQFRQSCVSRRSIVEMDMGVLYASPDGICLVDGAGIRLVTQALMTKDNWLAYKPESIHATQIDGRYFAFYDTGVKQGCLVLDLSGDSGGLWESDVHYTAAYNDIRSDSLYLANAGSVQKWDSASSFLNYIWKSKEFVVSKPENFSSAQVLADAYPVTLLIYADKTLIHTQTVTSTRPFRLPSGFKSRVWQFEARGNSEVFHILLSSATSELKAA